jgi:hypothetical protein
MDDCRSSRRPSALPPCSFGLLLAAVLTAALPRAQAAQIPPLPPLQGLLERAAAYVDQYERHFAAVMSEESYRQQVTASGGAQLVRSRVTTAQVLVVHTGQNTWLWFRDVLEVNGSPLPDHVARLKKLFEQPASASADALAEANRIADASARYNLGPVRRTVNFPTMALTYLQGADQARSSFRADHAERVDGVPVEVVAFVETARPTVVRGLRNANVAARGKFWIEATGRVDRTELDFTDPATDMRATIDVTYAPQPAIPFQVPVKMHEHYLSGDEAITAEASYSKFQKVAVTVDVKIGRGGGGGRLVLPRGGERWLAQARASRPATPSPGVYWRFCSGWASPA